jgi:hypothetical protein
VRVVAIAALHGAFRDTMVSREGELRLHISVAGVAKFGL